MNLEAGIHDASECLNTIRYRVEIWNIDHLEEDAVK